MVLQILLTVLLAFVIGVLVGKWMIPVLRALKAGQSIREIGPSWHNSKAGTPTMGGIAFIAGCIACILVGIPSLKNGEYGHIFVFLMALAFGAIGFYDDYIKVKKKRNLGLTSLQVTTAAGARSTTTCLLDVPQDAGDAWLTWMKPRKNA